MNRTGEYRARNREIHPPAFAPDYKTSVARSPRLPLLSVQQSLSEITGPVFGHDLLRPLDNDLLLNGRVDQDPVGERIIVHGRVLDENEQPVPGALIEVWQANAGGRYRHVKDHYVAALDPNFVGCGRTLSDEDGWYRFRTIKPGPYPWRNRLNDWRPAHIHFSIFGPAFVTRLITQLYFEGDPLLPLLPDLPLDSRRRGTAAAGGEARPRRDDSSGHDRLSLRHHAARPPADADREQARGG